MLSATAHHVLTCLFPRRMCSADHHSIYADLECAQMHDLDQGHKCTQYPPLSALGEYVASYIHLDDVGAEMHLQHSPHYEPTHLVGISH